MKQFPATVRVDDIDASGTPSSSTFLRGDGAWATPAGGGGGVSDGDKGDITVSGGGATWTIDADVIASIIAQSLAALALRAT